jgi:hypothetical protein
MFACAHRGDIYLDPLVWVKCERGLANVKGSHSSLHSHLIYKCYYYLEVHLTCVWHKCEINVQADIICRCCTLKGMERNIGGWKEIIV